MDWVRIRSWHRVTFDSRGGQHRTRCGLWAPRDAQTAAELPLDEKSCETCLRLTARDSGS